MDGARGVQLHSPIAVLMDKVKVCTDDAKRCRANWSLLRQQLGFFGTRKVLDSGHEYQEPVVLQREIILRDYDPSAVS